MVTRPPKLQDFIPQNLLFWGYVKMVTHRCTGHMANLHKLRQLQMKNYDVNLQNDFLDTCTFE
jgi:hypothetical protein